MSTRAQQKCKYWPTPKAYAALTPKNTLVEDGVMPSASLNPVLDKGHEADLFERTILDEGLRQMRTWTPEEIIEILADAATILVTLRAEVWCDWCDGPVVEDFSDAEWVAWLGDSAPPFCSQACLDAHDEQRINAAGAS